MSVNKNAAFGRRFCCPKVTVFAEPLAIGENESSFHA